MTNEGAAKFDYLLKYIMIGDTAVGKTNLLSRYVHSQFKQEYLSTVGVDFCSKIVQIRNKTFKIQMWDLSGKENFRPMIRTYYKNSVCAFVIYDISRRDSFNTVSTWIEDYKNQTPKTTSIILVGNKSDLNDRRQVNTEEGQELADKFGIQFYEASAKTGDNVDEIFYNSTDEIAKKIEQNYYDLEKAACGIKQNK